MKLEEFLSKLNLALNSKTTYKKGGWGSHNTDTWYFDCVCMIKGILWGWNADFSKKRGGAVYASNGVPDIGTEQIINKCKNISTNFNNIQPGELVWMSGHVGIYVGNGEVIEATGAWERKVLKSKIASDGTRSKNGNVKLKWKKHGFLPYVDYGNASVPTPAPTESAYKTFVKGVQSVCGAKVDGIAGKETLSKTVTLSTSKNSKHKVVKVLQTYLISLGYSCGKCGADGEYGKDTKAAVKLFQKANGCVADGVIDAKNKTWKKLLKLA